MLQQDAAATMLCISNWSEFSKLQSHRSEFPRHRRTVSKNLISESVAQNNYYTHFILLSRPSTSMPLSRFSTIFPIVKVGRGKKKKPLTRTYVMFRYCELTISCMIPSQENKEDTLLM